MLTIGGIGKSTGQAGHGAQRVADKDDIDADGPPLHAALPETRRSLPIALMRARERVMEPVRRMLARSGISEQKWRILRVLAEHGSQDTGTLADLACIPPPSLTRLLQAMEDQRLAQRRIDPDDRRRQIVRITGLGRSLIAEHAEEATRLAQAWRSKLGPERYEQLLDLLEALDRP